MQQLFRIVLFVAFGLLAATPPIKAQIREVNYFEVLKLEQTAKVLLRAVPHRSTTTSWVFPERDKDPTWKSILIREVVSTDRSRWIQINESPASFKRMEVISIGEKHYRKVDDAPWQVMAPPSDYVGPSNLPTSGTSKPRIETQARLVETVNDKNGVVSVYETVSRSTLVKNGREVTNINTGRFWFRHDGMLLRQDMEQQTIGEPRVLKNSTVYEYDGISIEAPIK